MFSGRLKLLLWALAAFLVIVFFALLVNIILPGPYGGDSNTESRTDEHSSTRPAGKARP
jgi:hypothetical protein